MIENTNYKHTTSDNGFVSIFTLMFFIILASVFTVGFMRIVLDEAQQALYNSATNSALAAARAGIEDGKRAIILYNSTSDSGLKTALEGAFSDAAECDTLYSTPAIATALGLDPEGKVQTTNLDEQSYTCLKVKTSTDTYETLANPTKSAIIPLSAAEGFNRVIVRWHMNPTDGVPIAGTEVPIADNPTVLPAGLPTFMRLQFIKVPNNGSLSAIESYTGFLRSSTATTINPDASSYLMEDLDYLSPPKSAGVAPCDILSEYSCAVQIDLPSSPIGNITTPDIANNKYYLRITPMYKSAHVQVQMQQGAGITRQFLMVQPEIDSTGKSGDTLRRLKARVKFTTDVNLPEYVVESSDLDPASGSICKSFTVTAAGPPAELHAACPLPN